MSLPQSLGPFDSDDTSIVEEILEKLDPYLIARTQELASRCTSLIHPATLSLEIDEIIQRVRIKFWSALLVREIRYPHAYIRRIVTNEFNDLGRRPRSPLPLSLDDDGEVNRGFAAIASSEGMSDPSSEFEQKETFTEQFQLIAEAVATLPPRQRYAMIASLLRRVDDTIQLTEALRAKKINVEEVDWPESGKDAQSLLASASVARHKIAHHMNRNSSGHKSRGVDNTPLSFTDDDVC